MRRPERTSARLEDDLEDPLRERPDGAGEAQLADSPFCSVEMELAASQVTIHPLPDVKRPRRAPVSLSAAVHALLVLALVAQAHWMPAERPRPRQGLTVDFIEPVLPPDEVVQKPVQPTPEPALPPGGETPRPPSPQSPERTLRPVPPPPAPEKVPPPQVLPPPRRMGERVPIPHPPVPGTVPPEEGKTGKPGPPEPEVAPQPPGDPGGTNLTDRGAGPGEGPGAGDRAGEGRAGQGIVPGHLAGALKVPRLGGGSIGDEGTAGGGKRRGLNLNLPPDTGAFGDFAFESKDYDWSDYYSQMYWSIWRKWHHRLDVMTALFERWSLRSPRAPLKGSVLLRFVIERNGSVSSIEVLEPSVMSPLDDSAVSALKEVILPPLPPDFPRSSERVTGRFLMDVQDIEAWKMTLRSLKYYGYF